MKRSILIMAVALMTLSCFAEQYRHEKVAVFDNSDDGLPIREPWDVGEDGDATGNYICFSEDGELYIQNWDRYQLLKVNQKDYSLEVIHDLNFLQYGHTEHLNRIESGYYLFVARYIRVVMVDKNFDRKFMINNIKVSIPDFALSIYYDLDTDILFYENEHRELCSVVHPSCNLEQNKANVKNHEQTVYMLQYKTDVYTGDLNYTEESGLYKGNEEIFIDGYVINNNKYKKLEWTKEITFEINGQWASIDMNDETETEEVESIAIHPSGDLYALRYNQNTKIHTLYRVENTWDPEWRAQWYAEHEE